MTPEQKAEFDKMGRTRVLRLIDEPAMPETKVRAAYEWISLDDAERRGEDSDAKRAALSAKRAAWIAAIAAIIAAIWPIFETMFIHSKK